MASWIPRWRSIRLRASVPLFTRCVLGAILIFWGLELQSAWNVVQWGGLIPSEIGLGSMYRLNTYPLVHLGFFHFIINAIALAPLMQRFEAEHGTLLSAAFFFGPLSSLPAGAYLLIEKAILRRNTAIQGASVWVFLLLANEAIKQYRANPFFALGSVRIPTWTSPLAVLVVVSALIPNTSFLGHLCAVGVGYLFGLGYLRLLAPPERVLRWIEGKLNLLARLPYYVSIDQKTYGRYGVLPTAHGPVVPNPGAGQRLGQ